MYRYLVFAYSHYYPMGGMDDCVFKSNLKAEAIKEFESWKGSEECIYVYDAKLDEVIMKEDVERIV